MVSGHVAEAGRELGSPSIVDAVGCRRHGVRSQHAVEAWNVSLMDFLLRQVVGLSIHGDARDIHHHMWRQHARPSAHVDHVLAGVVVRGQRVEELGHGRSAGNVISPFELLRVEVVDLVIVRHGPRDLAQAIQERVIAQQLRAVRVVAAHLVLVGLAKLGVTEEPHAIAPYGTRQRERAVEEQLNLSTRDDVGIGLQRRRGNPGQQLLS